MPPKKNKKPEQGRTIQGTITCGSKLRLTGSDEEYSFISNTLQNCHPNVQYTVTQAEYHKSGEIHFHFLIRFVDTTKTTELVKDLRSLFENWTGSKVNQIAKLIGNYKNWLGYIYKDRESFQPLVTGTPNINIEASARRWMANKQAKILAEADGYTIDKCVQKEQEMIEFVNEFMERKGYYVNWYTRELHPLTEIYVFLEELDTEGFSKIFGAKKLKDVRAWVSDNTYSCLRSWKPQTNLVKFNDGFWDMNIGKLVEVPLDTIPVKEYDMNTHDYKMPEFHINILKKQGIDVEHFREILGYQFTDAKYGQKTLLLHGVPCSGKTTLTLAFKDVFENVIGTWCSDRQFSLQHIAQYPKFHADEVNPFSCALDRNDMKKLCIGETFKVAVKRKDCVVSIPKRGIFTTNDNVDPCEYESDDTLAIRDRLYTVAFTHRLLEGVDRGMTPQFIVDEFPSLMLWSTIKNNK